MCMSTRLRFGKDGCYRVYAGTMQHFLLGEKGRATPPDYLARK